MKNFNHFNDIEHEPLRVFNRTVMFHNLLQDFGRSVALDYVKPLTIQAPFRQPERWNIKQRQYGIQQRSNNRYS